MKALTLWRNLAVFALMLKPPAEESGKNEFQFCVMMITTLGASFI